MKNYFMKISCLFFLIFSMQVCFSSTNKSTNSIFSIDLPVEMQLAGQNKHEEKNIYQYVFKTSPFGDYSQEQIRITVVGQAPEKTEDINDWETKALGANIAMFTNAYHLDLSHQAEALGQQPNRIKLGTQTFTVSTMTFDTMQTYFLVTTRKNATYNIILISINKDNSIRALQMEKLLKVMETMEYFDIKN